MATTLPGAPRRIAVFRALFLGDLLCAIPALDALDRRFPDAEIALIGLPWARELAGRLPAVDRFLEFGGYQDLPEVPYDPARTSAFLTAMQAERFDLAIQLHGSGEVTNGLVAELGAGATLGYGPDGDGRLTRVLPWTEQEHEVERWLRLVAELGAPGDGHIHVPIADHERAAAERLLAVAAADAGPLVGLHCGSKLASRRWPAARFAALGNALARRYGARIVLTGGPGERDLAEAVGSRLDAAPLDLVGATDLGTLFAVIERLDLLVTNDTGASHVAAATRTPSVVLFGPSRPARWAPLDRALHRPIETRAIAGSEDLADLPLAPVLAACERALDAVRPTPLSTRREPALEHA